MIDNNKKNTAYVLITPARNEEEYIEKTIQSVISQTILPRKWVIVSDSSTDRTGEIVRQYASKYGFIQLVYSEGDNNRNFGSKVQAFYKGYQQLKNVDYDFIGNLDADVTFEPDYYERVLSKFQEDVKLGIAGGSRFDIIDGNYQRVLSSRWHVCGAIQLFRRQCYEDIGGYITLEKGGEDAVTVIMARMHGWKVKQLIDIKILHHRPTGTAKGNILYARFRQGAMEYSLGYHPVYETVKFFSRIREKPYGIGSIFRLGGYCWAFLKRGKRDIPDEVVNFLRWEQMKRLKSLFKIQ